MVRVHHRPLRKARLGGLFSLLTVLAAWPAAPAGAQEIAFRPVGRFSSPTYVTSPPADASRLFVVQRRGIIRVVRRGRTLRRAFVDLSRDVLIENRAETRDQRGMLSMAFAPDYTRSGRFYVFYVDRADRIRVDELRRSQASGDRAQTSARRTLLAIDGAGPMHHGGQLAFGPDGLLYVSVGYGADEAAAQDPANLRGKILRLDPTDPAPRPEVYAVGLRNPYRFSFDGPSRSLLIADVGGDDMEEMTRLPTDGPAGANLGWPFREGEVDLRDGAPPSILGPTLAHRHSPAWCSIVGGYVARDPRLPVGIRNRYLYGDVCSGRIHAATLAGATRRLRGVEVPYLVSFGQDALRRLYAVSFQGGVWRIVARFPRARGS